jgi:5'-3' exonuclease
MMRMRAAGIEPVVIFDGRPPASKQTVIEQRRAIRVTAQKEMTELESVMESQPLTEMERATMGLRMSSLKKQAPPVTSSDKDQIKQFLYACGILFITAAGEADDVLAWLARQGTIQAVVSTDMDMLPRGIPLLVIPETPDAATLSVIHTPSVLQALGLTAEQFAMACVMMGCDYTSPEWRTVKPATAVEMVRKGGHFGDHIKLKEAVGILLGTTATWEDLVAEVQRTKWDAGAPPKEPEALLRYVKENEWPLDWYYILMQ